MTERRVLFKRGKKGRNIMAGKIMLCVLILLLVVALAISACRLYQYYNGYRLDGLKYEDLRERVVESEGYDDVTKNRITDREKINASVKEACEPLFSINWDKLKAINNDICGWVYFPGIPPISYPILQAEDNDFYVNRSYDLNVEDSKAGSIFMDYRMNSDFTSPYSIIYGHTLRDGSMLTKLVKMKDQKLYEEYPYFWIYTPQEKLCYKIFSVFQCSRSDELFQKTFKTVDNDFADFYNELRDRNIMNNNTASDEPTRIIIFSTCVPDSYDRTIVCGKYVYSAEL